jgi:hypothetical protein
MNRIKRVDMKKDRIIGMLAVGLLGLLGFSSCSPRLRVRRIDKDVDTLKVFPLDSGRFKPNPVENPPIKLMYGVPPARFEVKDIQGQDKKD